MKRSECVAVFHSHYDRNGLKVCRATEKSPHEYGGRKFFIRGCNIPYYACVQCDNVVAPLQPCIFEEFEVLR